jgi:hypothetical protein
MVSNSYIDRVLAKTLHHKDSKGTLSRCAHKEKVNSNISKADQEYQKSHSSARILAKQLLQARYQWHIMVEASTSALPCGSTWASNLSNNPKKSKKSKNQENNKNKKSSSSENHLGGALDKYHDENLENRHHV